MVSKSEIILIKLMKICWIEKGNRSTIMGAQDLALPTRICKLAIMKEPRQQEVSNVYC